MNIGDIVNAIKEFFLDILGFLIPGLFFILLLSIITAETLKFKVSHLGILDSGWESFLLFFWAYIVGYVIYPLSEYTDKFFYKLKFLSLESTKAVETSIENSDVFELCKAAVGKLIAAQAVPFSPTTLYTARSLRSVIMSYIPEADTKIYTFMFRSEICKNTGSSSLFTIFYIILCLVIEYFTNIKLLTNNKTALLVILIILLLGSIMLIKSRTRFYGIAQRIPFSIFVAKYYKI